MTDPPVAVKIFMRDYNRDEQQAKRWIEAQHLHYEGIPSRLPHASFPAWVATQLGCSVKDAENVLEWAEQEK